MIYANSSPLICCLARTRPASAKLVNARLAVGQTNPRGRALRRQNRQRSAQHDTAPRRPRRHGAPPARIAAAAEWLRTPAQWLPCVDELAPHIRHQGQCSAHGAHGRGDRGVVGPLDAARGMGAGGRHRGDPVPDRALGQEAPARGGPHDGAATPTACLAFPPS